MKRKFIIASLCLTMPLVFVLIMTAHGSNGRYAQELGQTYSGTWTETTTTTNADHSVVITRSNSAPVAQTNTVPQAR